jgi:hypothetical protein
MAYIGDNAVAFVLQEYDEYMFELQVTTFLTLAHLFSCYICSLL